MTRPPIPTIKSLRDEDSAANIAVARERALEAMGDAVVGRIPGLGVVTARGLLCIALGGDVVHADMALRAMTSAYDIEMCAEWGRYVRPIAIKLPVPWWKREAERLWRVALPILAGFGASVLLAEVAAVIVKAVR